jgi:hypothetical protein
MFLLAGDHLFIFWDFLTEVMGYAFIAKTGGGSLANITCDCFRLRYHCAIKQLCRPQETGKEVITTNIAAIPDGFIMVFE